MEGNFKINSLGWGFNVVLLFCDAISINLTFKVHMVPLKKVVFNPRITLFLEPVLRLKQPSWIEIHHNLETSTSDPLKYKMDNPLLIVSICMRKSIRIQKVKFCKGNSVHPSYMYIFIVKKEEFYLECYSSSPVILYDIFPENISSIHAVSNMVPLCC